jgi:hypothetical protein
VLVHDGQVVNKGEMIVDSRPIGETAWACWVSKHWPAATSSTKCRTSIVCRSSASRWSIRAAGRERLYECGRQTAGYLQKRAAGYYQGIAVDRLLHLGRIVPGKHPRLDRSGDHGQARRSARPEGKRHRRPPGSWRYRSGIPPSPEGERIVGSGRASGIAAAEEGQEGAELQAMEVQAQAQITGHYGNAA